jgi:hypothetical protein
MREYVVYHSDLETFEYHHIDLYIGMLHDLINQNVYRISLLELQESLFYVVLNHSYTFSMQMLCQIITL